MSTAVRAVQLYSCTHKKGAAAGKKVAAAEKKMLLTKKSDSDTGKHLLLITELGNFRSQVDR